MTSQNALNTTAHNMANIDTEGYTRQQVSQGTRFYSTISQTASANAWQQIGLGVEYNNCKQVRSEFLDKNYRAESGRSSFYDLSYKTIQEVEDQLQEMNGAEFSDALTNLWTSVQELSKDPTSAVNQSAFVTRSQEFVERAQSVYQGLQRYQSNLDQTVAKQVNQINKYGDRIAALNEEIVKIECGGVEHANDLRDERNMILDKLGEMGKIDYKEDVFGNVLVQFEGTSFVTSDHVNHMACETQTLSTHFNQPYWEFAVKYVPDSNGDLQPDYSGAYVYDMTLPISSDMNTDIGQLRSTLLARGDHYATYHDIQDDPTNNNYNQNVAQSVIMNTQAEFDQLFNNVVKAINNVLENSNSNPAALDPDGLDPEGKPNERKTYVMFTTMNPTEVTHLEWKDDLGNPAYNDPAGTAAADAGKIGTLTDLTIMNTMVNDLLVQQPSLNTYRTAEGNADNDTMNALKDAFNSEEYTLNPNVATQHNILNSYNSLVAQIANSGSVYKSISENQKTTVDSIGSAREQIVGASSDEELQFMIQFQNAYNASSRYINVVSEMLDNLLSSLTG